MFRLSLLYFDKTIFCQGICNNGDVRIKNDGTPWLYWDNHWSPICTVGFSDNNNGATLFCKKLGYQSGKIIKKSAVSKEYPLDAFQIGKCMTGDRLQNCKGGGNEYMMTDGCRKNNTVLMRIGCEGGVNKKMNSSCKGKPYENETSIELEIHENCQVSKILFLLF